MVGVLDGLHSKGEGGVDVLALVVDEEDLCGRGFETFSGGGIDGGFGFCEEKLVRPDVVIKGGEPIELAEEAVGHSVTDVGENAGTDACGLKALCPLDHGGVEAGPELDVGVDEAINLIGGECCPGVCGDLVPIVDSVQFAAIVGVTKGPVAMMEDRLFDAGDLEHTLPLDRVGRQGENLAVVKEDCMDGIHGLAVIVGGALPMQNQGKEKSVEPITAARHFFSKS